MNRRRGSRAALLAFAVGLSACGSSVATVGPSATVSASASVATADDSLPSLPLVAAATPTASPRPTATPTRPATPRPSPTVTPVPTPTPLPWWMTPPKVTIPAAVVYPAGALPASGESAPLVYSGSRKYPAIAITVDDCLSKDAVLADLAVFKRYHVNATFFPIGSAAARNPSLWKEVDAAHFPIGNHTYDHKSFLAQTYTQIYADIVRDNETMASIVGHPIMPFLRPPGGGQNATVLKAAAAAGERAVVDWNASDGDTGANARNVPVLIIQGERGRYGSILLVHANGEYVTRALPWIINYYSSRGYVFETLGQLLGVPGPVPFGPES